MRWYESKEGKQGCEILYFQMDHGWMSDHSGVWILLNRLKRGVTDICRM